MNYEKYIDKAFGLFQALLLALMTALFGGISYLVLHFEEIAQTRFIIISAGLGIVLFGVVFFGLALAKILKELRGG